MKHNISTTEKTWRTFKRDYRLVSCAKGISAEARVAFVDYYRDLLRVSNWVALLTSGTPSSGDQLTERLVYGQRRVITGPDQRLP